MLSDEEKRQRNRDYQRKYRSLNLEKVREYDRARIRKRDLKKLYGLSLDDFQRLLSAQDFKCAICSADTPRRAGSDWAVDHCHSTGRVRGILCHPCNTMLGLARDNPLTLSKAIQYLGQ
ncbi:endonuclease VII domain-containing protein [Bradyrhizobium sp. BR 10289]|nr:endonuclease VII domain-containing protein [Bradyrhizobium sp. BR 10289]